MISVDVAEQRVAVLEDDQVAEVYLERDESRSIAGNIYKGTVDNVLPGMEAAFVEIGLEKNGFLYVDEIVTPELEGRRHGRKIQDLLSRGEEILVQAVKDPMKSKGARLTTEISLPGRFVVYVPSGEGFGVSRRLPDEERARLRDILKAVAPKEGGMIVRTAGGHDHEEQPRGRQGGRPAAPPAGHRRDHRHRLHRHGEPQEPRGRRGGAEDGARARPDEDLRRRDLAARPRRDDAPERLARAARDPHEALSDVRRRRRRLLGGLRGRRDRAEASLTCRLVEKRRVPRRAQLARRHDVDRPRRGSAARDRGTDSTPVLHRDEGRCAARALRGAGPRAAREAPAREPGRGGAGARREARRGRPPRRNGGGGGARRRRKPAAQANGDAAQGQSEKAEEPLVD